MYNCIFVYVYICNRNNINYYNHHNHQEPNNHYNHHNNPLCQNLATIVTDTWRSGVACTNPATDGSFCVTDGRAGMKALCVER